MNTPTPTACTPPRRAATTLARHGARLSVLTLGLFSTMMLAGADGGGCVITVEPIEECTDIDDVCPNLECEVYATDDDGCTLCECADEPPPPPPEGCFSDSDCDDNEYCHFDWDEPVEPQPEPSPEPSNDNDDDGQDSSDGNAGPAPSDEDAAMIAPEGECRPIDDVCPAIGLIDCEEGYELFCYFDGQCDQCYCEPVDPPPPSGCESDDQCPDGLVCEIYEYCTGCTEPAPEPDNGGSDGDAAEPAPPECDTYCERWGECVEPIDPPPLSCDNVLCEQGTVCEETPDGPICVPTGEECWSDADCGEGQRCDIVYECPVCGDGDDDQNCLAPCYAEGRCVDDTIGQCDDGTEPLCDMIPPVCEDGQVLAVQNYCYSCVDPDTCGYEPPLSCANVDCDQGYECIEGFNGPVCVPLEEGCYSDNDCGDNQYCNANDVCMLPPECQDENSDVACPAVCYGFCENLDEPTDDGQEPNQP